MEHAPTKDMYFVAPDFSYTIWQQWWFDDEYLTYVRGQVKIAST